MPLKQAPETAHVHFLQLTSAVAYLHERGITHNDIKPQNVVISNRNVAVLIDFGFANMYSTRQRGAFLSEDNLGTLEVSFDSYSKLTSVPRPAADAGPAA